MPLAIATSRRIAPTAQSGGVARVGMIGRYHSLGRAGIMAAEATTNLIINPVFGNATTGYTATGSTIAASDEWAQWGRYSGKVTTNNAAASEGIYFDVAGYAVSNATTFSVDLYGRGTVILRIDDGVATTDSTAITLSTTAQRKYVTRTLNAGATRCRCMILTNSQQLAVWYTDGWQCVTKAWDVPLASGSNADAPFSGTAHASTSVRTAPTLYYPASGIGDTFTIPIQFRTPPQIVAGRAQNFTLFYIYNGASTNNRARIYLDYDTGHEGHLMFYFADAAGTGTTTDTGVALAFDTDYWLFATVAKTSATASALSIYYAAAGIGGATALSTALASGAATGVRQAETTRLYIGTHSTTATCLNGIVYNWAIIPDVALTATQCLALLQQGANPPYTGTKYYGGMWLGYDAEELTDCVMIGADSHSLISPEGYQLGTLEENEDTVIDDLTLHISGDSVADLDDRVAAIERILSDAKGGRDAWVYRQPRGGQQLRAMLSGGDLVPPDDFHGLTHAMAWVAEAELSLTREPLWRDQEQQLPEDRAVTNYSATVLTSPIPIFNPGDSPAPLRLIMQNPSTDGWGWAEYAIGRKFGTPASVLYDFNGTAHANSLGGHGAVATLGPTYVNAICSQSITTDRWPRYYRVLIHAACTSVTYPFDFVVCCENTYALFGEAAVVGHATNLSLTTNDILQTLDLGVVRWPWDARVLAGGDAQALTMYIYAKTATGTPDMSVDYLRLLPCDCYGRLSFATTYLASDVDPFAIWDGESGIATAAATLTGTLTHLALSSAPTGIPPMLAPGWNNLCVWGHTAETAIEADYASTLKLGQSTFIPRYRSVKGAI